MTASQFMQLKTLEINGYWIVAGKRLKDGNVSENGRYTKCDGLSSEFLNDVFSKLQRG